MKAIFNSRTVSASEVPLQIDNRALQYGDSLFETIICRHGKALRLELHCIRLNEGMQALGFNPNQCLNFGNLDEMISNLLLENNLMDVAGIKIQVWRKAGGLYEPENNDYDFLITAREKKWEGVQVVAKAGLAEGICTNPSLFSAYKTGSALLYVQAARQKKAKKWGEIILTDPFGNLSEASASNIFWVKGKEIFTPSLKTGCLSGVKRKWLMGKWAKMGIEVDEVEESPDTLSNADYLITTNTSGNKCIEKFLNFSFKTATAEDWWQPLLEM
jgi:branched-subunit amino acid aminotransferase/4-amino-4-deoxychorismate lyase